MKKTALLSILLFSLFFVNRQASTQGTDSPKHPDGIGTIPLNSHGLDLNAMSLDQALKINSFISSNSIGKTATSSCVASSIVHQ